MLLLLTLRKCPSISNLKKKCRHFHYTGFLPSSKLVHADAKKLIVVTEYLVSKRMSLLLASKIHRKYLKNCRNQTMLEKRKNMYFTV